MSMICVCFTLNNWTIEEKAFLTEFYTNYCNYLVYGDEIGPKDGTPHLQGYFELKKKTRFTTLKKLLGNRYHLGARYGTQKQAIEYCKEDGKVTEMGKPKRQGQRKDLDAVRQCAIDSGMRHVSSIFSGGNIRTAEKFLTYNECQRNKKPIVYWLWGPTGLGKTKLAHEMCKEKDFWKKTSSADGNNKWFDGYDGHEAVILDDFRDTWWSLSFMLSLLDRYSHQVEIKGGHRQFLATFIIITCPYKPELCYQNIGEDIKQLTRRIDYTIEFNINKSVPEVNCSGSVPELREHFRITENEVLSKLLTTDDTVANRKHSVPDVGGNTISPTFLTGIIKENYIDNIENEEDIIFEHLNL